MIRSLQTQPNRELRLPVNADTPSELIVEFEGYKTWIVRSAEHRRGVYALRHDVYSVENSWVAPSPDGLERDEFDPVSTHLAVTAPDGTVIATIRHTDFSHDWMVERFFRDALLGELEEHKCEDACEASRMAVHRNYRSREIVPGINCLDMLLAGVYYYTRFYCGYRKIVLATLPIASLALQRRRTPLRQLGPILTMDDGCKIAGYEVELAEVNHTTTAFAQLVDRFGPDSYRQQVASLH